MTFSQIALLFSAAVAGGAINSLAGGGTLLTFPVLLGAGLPALTANATNTLAMVPGAWSSALGYRRELSQTPKRFFYLIIPSVMGGAMGALLLARTPEKAFASLVPYLILFATVLFMLQEPIQRRLRKGATEAAHPTMGHATSGRWLVGASVYQFFVSVYGGYFGAGIGILMLAALGVLGMTDIYQMNGLKSVLGSVINGIAAIYFVRVGLIDWPAAALLTLGAIIGNYASAGLARRIGRQAVRRVVIAIGLAMTVSLLIRR